METDLVTNGGYAALLIAGAAIILTVALFFWGVSSGLLGPEWFGGLI